MIRITGGEDRSRLLEIPAGGVTKPTMDMMRQAIFSALSYDIYGKTVLDLFAGSGSYSFESLSRGAKHATLVECHGDVIAVEKRNARTLKREEQVNIINENTEIYLGETNEKFDIVFIDPPYCYETERYEKLVKTLISREIIKDNGIIVLESDKELNIDKSMFKDVRLYEHGVARAYILRK